jgi:tripartite-type tricarboxylate transporter receptor subunit TctC
MSAKAAAAAILALFACAPARGEAFLGGKQIHLMVATPPGGGYDAYARLVARYLPEHLPGKPSVVVNNMAGASGMTGTNWLYEIAPRDGTVIGTFNKSEPFYEALGTPGARFKSDRFSWIGNLSQAPDTVNVSDRAGVATIEEAKQKAVDIGADSGGTMTLYPALLNAMVGTKFRIVTGYAGSAAVYHAIELDEVRGVGSTPWTTWKATRPDWVRDHKILALVQIGLKKDPDLPDVPRLVDLATTDEQRALFNFVSAVANMERPYAAPPGVPADVLAQYREGFSAMARDPAFVADAARMSLDLDPRDGESLAGIVHDIVTTPPQIVAKTKEFLAGAR